MPANNQADRKEATKHLNQWVFDPKTKIKEVELQDQLTNKGKTKVGLIPVMILILSIGFIAVQHNNINAEYQTPQLASGVSETLR